MFLYDDGSSFNYKGFCSKENDSKRARAVKKANDEREMKKQKDKDILR